MNEPLTIPKEGRHFRSVDLGTNNPAVVVEGDVDPITGQLYNVKTYKLTWWRRLLYKLKRKIFA